MVTTKSEITEWFDRGVGQGATHLIVVRDNFDYEYYPVFVEAGKDAREVAQEYDGKNMQKIMEVYNLRLDKAMQVAEWRAFHW